MSRILDEVATSMVENWSSSGDEEAEEETQSGAVLVTVLVLILATIGFERMKEMLEERANKTFEPVIEKLFGELAVLGFLSLCTFCLAQTHVFEILASGELDEEDIEHIVEITHYMLFFIVVKSVVNVCVLIKQAESIMNRWGKFYKLIHVHGRDAFLKRKRPKMYRKSLARSVLPDLAEDSLFLKFCALEEEFNLDRKLDPPFAPSLAIGLDNNFNFAAYLGKCLEKTLEEIVEIQEPTYWIFAVFAILFYVYNSFILEGNKGAMAWIWVALNYSVLGFNALFVNHLSKVADSLGANSDGIMDRLGSTRMLLRPSKVDPYLPLWCSIELTADDVKNHRNRQEKLFLFQERGPKVYMIMLQTNLVFSSIYWAMLFLSYFPYMYAEQHLGLFCVYVVIAFIPPQFMNKQWISILALLTEVLSVGHLRRPRVIAAVIRDQKIESMIRSFLMIKRVEEFVQQLQEADNDEDTNTASKSSRTSFLDPDDSDRIVSRSSSQSVMIRRRVEAAFDTMDSNGDGQLDEGEFELLMQNLGVPITQEMGHKIVQALDIDGDGVIDVDELEVFYKAVMTSTSCPHDMAKDLFSVFDTNCNGVISPNEFVRTLEGLKLGFSTEDIGLILQEVDEDGDGEITFHEFERVIKEYMPAELFGDSGDDDDDEELAVHPCVTILESIGYFFQDCFSFGKASDRQQRRRSSVERAVYRRSSVVTKIPPVVEEPTTIPEGVVQSPQGYGSFVSLMDVSTDYSEASY